MHAEIVQDLVIDGLHNVHTHKPGKVEAHTHSKVKRTIENTRIYRGSALCLRTLCKVEAHTHTPK